MCKKEVRGIIFLFFLSFGCGKKEGVLSLSASPSLEETSLQQIENFVLEGFTEEGKKHWELMAESADVEESLVKMDQVKAIIWDEKGKIDIKGKKGEYDKRENKICLNDDVSIETSEGTKLLTDKLVWDVKKQEASTDSKVIVEKENMVAKGKGGTALTEIKKVELKENVEVRVEPKTIITCKGPLELDYEKNIAKFYEEVMVEDERGNIYADRMEIILNPQTKKIEKIFAYGNVKVVREENVAYADEGVYSAEEGKVILKGRPKLVIETE